jgi:hypothetical protein
VLKVVGDELKEVKAEQQILKTQNTELKEEVLELQTRLSTISVSPPFSRSWASVAAGQSATGTATTRSSSQNTQSTTSIRISTQPSNAEDGTPTGLQRNLPSNEANTMIRNALQNNETTKEVRLAGVGSTRTGYVVRFRDENSTQTARECTEWLKNLGNGTKLVRPRFGVVVHRTPTAGINLRDEQASVIKNIMEENGLENRKYKITEAAWLKRQDKQLGAAATLGVWFESAEAAQWTVNNGLVFGQRFVGSIEHHQFKKKRCYRCSNQATWRGPARRKRDADTVPETTNGRIAHQARHQNASTAMAHTQLETGNVNNTRQLSSNAKQPTDSTAEHHEIKSRHGGTHQRQTYTRAGYPPYPRTTTISIPNSRQSQTLATVPTHAHGRRSQEKEPHLCQQKDLNVRPPPGAMQYPGRGSG